MPSRDSWSLTHGTQLVHRETQCMQVVSQQHIANLCLQTQEDLLRKLMIWKENTQNLAIPTPRFSGKFSTWNPPSHAEEAYPKNYMVEQPR